MIATRGTAAHLQENGVDAEVVLKIQEGRPNASDLLKNKDISMMFITSTGKEVDVADGRSLRRLALALKVPIITTMAGANATVQVCFASSARISMYAAAICSMSRSSAVACAEWFLLELKLKLPTEERVVLPRGLPICKVLQWLKSELDDSWCCTIQ